MLRRVLVTLGSWAMMAAVALAQQPPTSPDGFVPASELPPGQQLPAGPFLVGSYAFFLVLMMFYLWTVWQRIGKVEREMRDLERRQGAARR
jgi:hypothetical protein